MGGFLLLPLEGRESNTSYPPNTTRGGLPPLPLEIGKINMTRTNNTKQEMPMAIVQNRF
jgi:hypothetical protein